MAVSAKMKNLLSWQSVSRGVFLASMGLLLGSFGIGTLWLAMVAWNSSVWLGGMLAFISMNGLASFVYLLLQLVRRSNRVIQGNNSSME